MATNEYQTTTLRPTVAPGSMYTKAPVYNSSGTIFYSTVDIKKFPDDMVGTNYVVLAEEEGRLDLVSLKFYGTTALWWLIAYANNIIDPFIEVVAGSVIIIPDKTEESNVIW